MKVQTSDDCRLITIDVPQLSDLFRGGLVEEIDVKITHNCCNSYDFKISSDTSDCVWTAYGDYLASPLLPGIITFTGVCAIRIDRVVGNDLVPEFIFNTYDPSTNSDDCEACFDLTDPAQRQDLVDTVNDWLAINGGGEFILIMSDGIPNTPYEQSLGAGSAFTMSFEGISGDLIPRLRRHGLGCGQELGGITGGFYSIPDLWFTCGGLESADFVFSENQIKIRPSIMGKNVFPDGVYQIEVKAVSSDGTKTSVNQCIFVDCELSCKVLDSGNTEAFLIYYLLKETGECDCDCQTLCDLLKLTY